MLRQILAHADEAEISQVGIPVGVAFGEKLYSGQRCGELKAHLDQARIE